MLCDKFVASVHLTPDRSAKILQTGRLFRTLKDYQTYMARGTVKWFNEKKGFGFIMDPSVNGDIFVHFSAIQTNGFRTLKEGEEVEYELYEDQKGSRAKNVVRV